MAVPAGRSLKFGEGWCFISVLSCKRSPRGRAMSQSKEHKLPELSRREFVGIAAATAAGFVRQQGQTGSSIVRTDLSTLGPYGNGTIPAGIRSRSIPNVNGLTVH